MTYSTRRRFLAGTSALVATGLASASLGFEKQVQPAAQKLTVTENKGRFMYNGTSPGPTFQIDPGDSLDIELVNELPALHDDCAENANRFHGLNTTNLHTHGLHVSPTKDASGTFDADNVFVSVTPRGQIVPCEEICGTSVAETFREHRNVFRFELGANHPSGTFWYHAHKHGSVTRQVGGGLAGPLIVRDKPGDMPDYIAKAPEKLFMLMNWGLVLVDPDGGGETDPKIQLRPGEVQRWRIINAQVSGQGGGSFARLSTNVPDLEMYQIAYDGLTLPKRIKVDQYDREEPWINPAALAPGNRMDVMVRVPKEAKARNVVVDVAARLADRLDFGSSTNRIALELEISGAPVDHIWSDDPTLPAPEIKPFDETPLPRRVIDYQGAFRLDDEQFSGETKQVIRLGAEEEWEIQNSTSAVHAHHIHVNPFLVTHINGKELALDDPLRRWQDTIALPFNTGDGPGTITYKTRFESFTGAFVLHCHILRHEDRGMMQAVEVVA